MGKRIISLIITVALVIAFLPVGLPVRADGEHIIDGSTYTAWTNSKEMPAQGGYYYLDTDVQLDESWTTVGTVNLCLHGHTVKLKKNVVERPIITIPAGSELTIRDEDNTGTVTGGLGAENIRVYGIFNFYGGTISDSSLAGIDVQSGGVANMYWGVTSDNQFGVYVDNGGKLNLFDGVITRNENSGVVVGTKSALSLKATCIMYGGEIINNTAKVGGGGVRVNQGHFTLKGGEITGNKSQNDSRGGGILGSDSVNISGSANVYGNTNSKGEPDNLYLEDAGTVHITGPVSNTKKIGVAMSDVIGTFAFLWNDYNEGKDPADYFESDTPGYFITADELGWVNINAPSHEHSDGLVFEDMWPYDNCLPTYSGSYFLTEDVSLGTSGWEVPRNADISICLCGHSITGSGSSKSSNPSVIKVQEGATLRIYDDSDQGMITQTHNINRRYGPGIIIDNGSFYLYGGQITGIKATGPSNTNGGAVSIINGGKCYLYGGSITNNTTSSSRNGGGVYVGSGELHVNGKTVVTRNTKGGGAWKDGTFPNGVPNNIYLTEGQKVIVDDIMSNTTPIAVCLEGGDGVITSGYTEKGNSEAYINTRFTSDMGYDLRLNDAGEIELYVDILDESVELDQTSLTLEYGGPSAQLTATVLPENATNKNVSWSSSDESVAVVDSNGKVSAVDGGTAVITVKTTNGNTATCDVTVNGHAPVHTHSYTATVTKAATCISTGIMTYTCECGDYYTETIPKKTHTYTSHDDEPATCLKEGVRSYTCSVCGYSYTEVIPVKAHTLTAHAAKEPTCTEEGLIAYWTCNVCGKFFKDKNAKSEITEEETVVKALGHDLKIHEEVPATCYSEGSSVYWICDRCGKIFADDKAENEAKEEDFVIAKTPHTLVHLEEREPTCTEDGNIDCWSCKVCAKNFSDENGMNELKEKDAIKKASGHDMTEIMGSDATCRDEGQKTYYICDFCKKSFFDAEGTQEIENRDDLILEKRHKLVYVDEKPATYTESGNRAHWLCTVCDKCFEDENGEHELSENEVTFPMKKQPVLKYRAYVQKKNWMTWQNAIVGIKITSANLAGTKDNLRMETIQMQLSGIGGAVKYRAYCAKKGWTQWATTADKTTYAGTKGESRRVEMIQLAPKGEIATYYDLYYRTYCEKFGWLGWAKNSEKSGSAGYARKLEGFQVQLVPKGTKFGTSEKKAFYDKTKDE